jgi:3-deoxy-D-manno-octulosonic-acid transferase
MALVLYQLLVALCLPLLFVYHLWRRDTRKRALHFYGLFREELSGNFLDEECDWFHAVSYGEARLLLAFIEMGCKEGLITRPILFTSTIENALVYFTENCKRICPNQEVQACFLPLDFLPILVLFLNRLRPRRFFLGETDFWPALHFALRQRKIPSYLINGRISSGLSQGCAMAPVAAQSLFSGFKLLCLQTKRDKNFIAPYSTQNLMVLGNAKFDLLPEVDLSPLDSDLPSSMRQLIVFGSFHPDEFYIPLALRAEFSSDFLFVIAPRNLETLAELKHRIVKAGYSQCLLSEPEGYPEVDFVLVDSMGKLAQLYKIAHLAVIGGSFNLVGGHNFLEPLVYRRPTIVGPGMRNYHQDLREFLTLSLVWQVADLEALLDLIKDYEGNPKPYIESSLKAFHYLESKRGVLRRTWDLVSSNP